MPDSGWLPWAGAIASLFAGLMTAGHAIIHKRDPRSATIWVLAVILIPIGGALAYLFFGVNRINRRARRLRSTVPTTAVPTDYIDGAVNLPENLVSLSCLVGEVAGLPLTTGNRCVALKSGQEAYPRMLEAIENARYSIALASYIFDAKGIGADFVDALVRAQQRGVCIKVIIDDVYARMSLSDAFRPLRSAGIDTVLFNPPLLPARLHAINLRNHRKLLLVDDDIGFTGGMNIHRPYWQPDAPELAMRDLHFELAGPVLEHLKQTFARDWFDAANEWLPDKFWGNEENRSENLGMGILARGIEAGPDETIDRMRWTFIGAINAAKHRICIRTPYFIPDQATIAAINAAAMRGVVVDIVVPENSDHKFVKWASQAHYWQVMEYGARIHERPGPFDHGKLMLVDGAWLCLGSANWDARSLRLNFEFNVEIYDTKLATELEGDFYQIVAESLTVDSRTLHKCSTALRLRNGIARLFAPVL